MGAMAAKHAAPTWLGHRECEQPLPSALGSVISGLGGSNEAELAIVAGGVFPTTSGVRAAATGDAKKMYS